MQNSDEQEIQRDATSSFQWSKHWYPVSLEDCLLKDKPNKVTLLGRDYVVWQDNGVWNVAKDECPHRCALVLPLERLLNTHSLVATRRLASLYVSCQHAFGKGSH